MLRAFEGHRAYAGGDAVCCKSESDVPMRAWFRSRIAGVPGRFHRLQLRESRRGKRRSGRGLREAEEIGLLVRRVSRTLREHLSPWQEKVVRLCFGLGCEESHAAAEARKVAASSPGAMRRRSRRKPESLPAPPRMPMATRNWRMHPLRQRSCPRPLLPRRCRQSRPRSQEMCTRFR
jgi:hypothetical protein